MQKKKILRLTTLLDFGGQEKQYLSFTEKPELLQHHYVFAAIGFGGNAEGILRERGFEVYIFNRKFAIKNILNIWTVYKFIKKIKPDVVHTAAAEANFHGIIAAKLAGVKIIVGEEIGIPNHSPIAIKIFKLVYKLADKIICVSKSVKDHLIIIGEIPSYKGEVIYNPVSIPSQFPQQKSDNFKIVYVGRLESVKNVEILIKAFSNIENNNAILTIVGDGRERSNLELLVKKLNLKSRITFAGFSSEPSKYVSSANLFVLPSFSEGFGIAAVEAMFLKVPVLGSRVGGIPEFISDNKNGWLFDPKNQNELESKLKMIMSMDDADREKIGKKAYEDVIEKFTVKMYVNNLEKFYESFNPPI
ncbi:glycosyltransferase [Epilithonimonas xixisoli]|uniref:Glycosyltransferase involved in cell wall biosynthesis n=1 Tax=Epilithonimonas xixisoli TaxID=1476462 RepID=A0A4R8I5D2_9FLAO|nr:glycosyltransferase [Epilithonimonas xixisoli]TDX84092.1 glycosyltransferase involved in cell wall biosynthesis [Epilithonimonas xixisoli]